MSGGFRCRRTAGLRLGVCTDIYLCCEPGRTYKLADNPGQSHRFHCCNTRQTCCTCRDGARSMLCGLPGPLWRLRIVWYCSVFLKTKCDITIMITYCCLFDHWRHRHFMNSAMHVSSAVILWYFAIFIQALVPNVSNELHYYFAHNGLLCRRVMLPLRGGDMALCKMSQLLC